MRACMVVLTGVAIGASVGAMSATGASSSVVVTLDVASATSLDAAGCATGTTNITRFGSVLPATSAVTPNSCVVRFGSSNDTARLRVAQQDRLGRAMWQYTRGALDTTFDGPSGTGDGRFLLPIGSGMDYATSTVVQADGKLIVIGYCAVGTGWDFCAARIHADGSWDATYDGPSGTGDGRFLLPIGTSFDIAYSGVLQPDGKLLITGHCFNGSNYDFCAARLNTDGSWDTTFDGPSGTGDGRFLLPIGAARDQVRASVLQPNGKLLIAGYCTGTTEDFCAARLNTDGSWDTTFDGPSGSGDGRFLLPVGAGHDYAMSTIVQADGRLLLTGHCHNGTNDDFCAARLDTDGSWDTTFDGPTGTGNGRFLLPIGAGNDIGFSIALQPDGRQLIGGRCHNGTNDDFCAARLNTDGTWDTTFDGPTGSGDGRFLLPIGAGNDAAMYNAVQVDGRQVITGICHNGTNSDFCAARLNADGSWDTTFDGPTGTGDGRFLFPVGAADDSSFASVLQGDGKLLVTGYCHNGTDFDFCAASMDQAGRLDDYAGGSRDWSVGTSMFGACLESVAAGATATWTLNAGCAQTNGTSWNSVQATPSVIATTGVAGTINAEARLRFGMRTAAGQPPGNYVAPISFDVVAPAA